MHDLFLFLSVFISEESHVTNFHAIYMYTTRVYMYVL